ncbi:hypothetical protein NT6N_28240 [Oceaniferula spumae]|uniref:methylated-DNA--[protein]-cysteine S-methyltransferase n=1 Tax=Oceaniferula spumae TaxID=2979115 RepID=A0AAT9FPC1_9BACT
MSASQTEESAVAVKISTACRLLEACDQAPSLDTLARAVGMSSSHFHRQFKVLTGQTPKAYAVAQRAGKIREQIRPKQNITRTIYQAGYNSSGRYYEQAKQILGMNAKVYKQGGVGETIRFAIGQTELGAILVAMTEQGICAISLGDDPEPLCRELQDRFPNAQLVGDDAKFDAHVAKVVGFVENPQIGLDLPLDIRGTAFQQRVWQALLKVPPGSTASYSELAEKMGSPKSVRAVASACAANKVAVAIPCHRIIRTDGSLSNYRWGVQRKAELLHREQS